MAVGLLYFKPPGYFGQFLPPGYFGRSRSVSHQVRDHCYHHAPVSSASLRRARDKSVVRAKSTNRHNRQPPTANHCPDPSGMSCLSAWMVVFCPPVFHTSRSPRALTFPTKSHIIQVKTPQSSPPKSSTHLTNKDATTHHNLLLFSHRSLHSFLLIINLRGRGLLHFLRLPPFSLLSLSARCLNLHHLLSFHLFPPHSGPPLFAAISRALHNQPNLAEWNRFKCTTVCTVLATPNRPHPDSLHSSLRNNLSAPIPPGCSTVNQKHSGPRTKIAPQSSHHSLHSCPPGSSVSAPPGRTAGPLQPTCPAPLPTSRHAPQPAACRAHPATPSPELIIDTRCKKAKKVLFWICESVSFVVSRLFPTRLLVPRGQNRTCLMFWGAKSVTQTDALAPVPQVANWHSVKLRGCHSLTRQRCTRSVSAHDGSWVLT